mgnify:CR=1 FL=1
MKMNVGGYMISMEHQLKSELKKLLQNNMENRMKTIEDRMENKMKKFEKMPFGLYYAAATFDRLMGKKFEGHLTNLEEIFSRIEEANLKLNSNCRRFVNGFADIAVPLHRLDLKSQFNWTAECVPAFKRLKNVLYSSPILNRDHVVTVAGQGRKSHRVLQQRIFETRQELLCYDEGNVGDCQGC